MGTPELSKQTVLCHSLDVELLHRRPILQICDPAIHRGSTGNYSLGHMRKGGKE